MDRLTKLYHYHAAIDEVLRLGPREWFAREVIRRAVADTVLRVFPYHYHEAYLLALLQAEFSEFMSHTAP